MTNPNSATPRAVFMDVAVHLRGRTPIASAILRNGLGKMIHVLELQDGECILMNRDLNHQKSRFKKGKLEIPGESTFMGWESRNDSLKNITEDAMKIGYQVMSSKRTKNLPLLQMPMVLTDQIAA